MPAFQEQQHETNGSPCVSSSIGMNDIPFPNNNSQNGQFNIDKSKQKAVFPSSNDSDTLGPTSILSHQNKIRLLYFFYRISTGSIIPIMSLYMQHAGWSSDQIGKLQSIRPIMTMLSAPMWGGLADRTGRKRLVLMVRIVFLSLTYFKIVFSVPHSIDVLKQVHLCRECRV